MSLTGSWGTTRGMLMYHAKLPVCRICKNKKCVQYPQRDIRVCARCFKRKTGKNLKGLFWEVNLKSRNEYIKYLENLLK